jgi:hypothetical protein
MTCPRSAPRLALAALAVALAARPARAADEAFERAVVQSSEGPAANLVDVAFRNEVGLDIGHKSRTANTMLVAPSFPTGIGAEWILAHQFGLPLVWQPAVVARTGGTYGLGDLAYAAYLAPAKPGAVTWGLGPALQFPTSSDDIIGDHKWVAGVAGAISVSRGDLLLGLNARQLWTYASTGNYPVVNRLVLEPVVSWSLRSGWYLVSAPTVTADWKRDAADRWTVPLGGGVGRFFMPGSQRLTLSLQVYATAARATGGYLATHPATSAPGWIVRAGVAILFPR